jgi:hypothetical protein
VRLSKLIEELRQIEARGFGDRRVVDEQGNDVGRVAGPLARFKDDNYEDEADAVMLSCFVERSPG